LGVFIFTAKVENREKEGREGGGGQAGGHGMRVPVGKYKSHALVNGTIHHRLLRIEGGWSFIKCNL